MLKFTIDLHQGISHAQQIKPYLPPPPPTKRERAWGKRARLILAAIALSVPALGWGQVLIVDPCIQQGATAATTNATVQVNSTAPVNSPIGSWITINHMPGYLCTVDFARPNRWVTIIGDDETGTTIGNSIIVDGQQYRILTPPGLPDVGYIVRWKGSVASNIWSMTQANPARKNTLGKQAQAFASRHVSQGLPAQYTVSNEVQVHLIKISPSWPGSGDSVNFTALLSEVYIAPGPVVGPQFPPSQNPPYTARVNVSFNVFTPTCTTPGVEGGNTVPLGVLAYTHFTGPGTAAPPVPFSMQVNCTAGFEQGVKYRFLACPTCTTPPPDSTLAMDNSATAQGVGVQILQSNGTTPVAFNTDTPLAGYNTGTGGQYTIPLRARIIQTCNCPSGQPSCPNQSNCVVPGQVRASMIMQMVYP